MTRYIRVSSLSAGRCFVPPSEGGRAEAGSEAQRAWKHGSIRVLAMRFAKRKHDQVERRQPRAVWCWAVNGRRGNGVRSCAARRSTGRGEGEHGVLQ